MALRCSYACSTPTTPVVRSGGRSLAMSKTPCPHCHKPMAKVPSTKVQKKYFLKCTSGCKNGVLFYSKFSKRWEPPRAKASEESKVKSAEATLTAHPCPVCQKPMEAYSYEKDGKAKKLLRCSDAKARTQAKHREAVYFHTAKGWWSPKHGNLESAITSER